MTTYTIALAGDMLVACVPDGDTNQLLIEAAEAELAPGTEVSLRVGLELTNELPEDDSRVVYIGGHQGWLSDGPHATGIVYKYAVLPV
jgi:hypothetical protein